MELALVRSLMDKSFYNDHRGYKCPDRLFSKDVRKIKKVIDDAMTKYSRDVTPDEVEALFMSSNFGLTTAQKQAFGDLLGKILLILALSMLMAVFPHLNPLEILLANTMTIFFPY